jgi:hypothetical protein
MSYKYSGPRLSNMDHIIEHDEEYLVVRRLPISDSYFDVLTWSLKWWTKGQDLLL